MLIMKAPPFFGFWGFEARKLKYSSLGTRGLGLEAWDFELENSWHQQGFGFGVLGFWVLGLGL